MKNNWDLIANYLFALGFYLWILSLVKKIYNKGFKSGFETVAALAEMGKAMQEEMEKQNSLGEKEQGDEITQE